MSDKDAPQIDVSKLDETTATELLQLVPVVEAGEGTELAQKAAYRKAVSRLHKSLQVHPTKATLGQIKSALEARIAELKGAPPKPDDAPASPIDLSKLDEPALTELLQLVTVIDETEGKTETAERNRHRDALISLDEKLHGTIPTKDVRAALKSAVTVRIAELKAVPKLDASASPIDLSKLDEPALTELLQLVTAIDETEGKTEVEARNRRREALIGLDEKLHGTIPTKEVCAALKSAVTARIAELKATPASASSTGRDIPALARELARHLRWNHPLQQMYDRVVAFITEPLVALLGSIGLFVIMLLGVNLVRSGASIEDVKVWFAGLILLLGAILGWRYLLAPQVVDRVTSTVKEGDKEVEKSSLTLTAVAAFLGYIVAIIATGWWVLYRTLADAEELWQGDVSIVLVVITYGLTLLALMWMLKKPLYVDEDGVSWTTVLRMPWDIVIFALAVAIVIVFLLLLGGTQPATFTGGTVDLSGVQTELGNIRAKLDELTAAQTQNRQMQEAIAEYCSSNEYGGGSASAAVCKFK